MDRSTVDVSWMQTRRDAARHRRKPTAGSHVTVTLDSKGNIPSDASDATTTILIHATADDGEIADWLGDAWWSELFQRWAPDRLTVVIAATPGALLHPIVLHQLEMVRRVVGNWHIVGEGHVSDIKTDDEVDQLATGPFHELRFSDECRSDLEIESSRESRFAIDELFDRIRARAQLTPFAGPTLRRIPRGG